VGCEIRITENAKADFLALDARWRSAVKRALAVHLSHQPTAVSKSRIKELKGVRKPQYRLRLAEIRIFYDVGEAAVTVLAIVPTSHADEWLKRQGVPADD